MEVKTTKNLNVQTITPEQVDEVKFNHVPNVAQYKGSDYANAVRVERGITVEKALEIAANDPEIDYFVYMKGRAMTLEFQPGQKYDPAKDPLHLVSQGCMRVFHHGDVVFFKNEGKWLGTAPGFADVYEKVK